jgi:hypothetical protein
VFGKELPNRCVVVSTVCFFRKEGKEVVLSRMFLAGGREDVRVDVHMKRVVVKLFSPFFFFGFVRNYDSVF